MYKPKYSEEEMQYLKIVVEMKKHLKKITTKLHFKEILEEKRNLFLLYVEGVIVGGRY